MKKSPENPTHTESSPSPSPYSNTYVLVPVHQHHTADTYWVFCHLLKRQLYAQAHAPRSARIHAHGYLHKRLLDRSSCHSRHPSLVDLSMLTAPPVQK